MSDDDSIWSEIFGERPFETEHTDVFFKGKTPEEIAEDREKRQARIGNERKANLFSSYVRSARRLLDSVDGQDLDPIAIPLTFTQRHAFELGLKDLIGYCKNVAEESQSMFVFERFRSLSEKDYEPMARHDLRPLVKLLEKALDAINFSGLPAYTEELAEYFTKHEGNGKHTAWRFSKTSRGTEHFQEEVILEPEKVQLWLEAFHTDIREEDASYERDLYDAMSISSQEDHFGWERASKSLELANKILEADPEEFLTTSKEAIVRALRHLAREHKWYIDSERQFLDWKHERED